MKVWSLTLFFVCLFILSFAQSEADQLIKDGIKFHDKQEYDKAIKRYEAALKLEPNNLYAHAEIAMTMMYASDFEGCIEHADVVIESGDRKMYAHAVAGKASCLDYLGKSEEAIELFKTALKKHGDDHMLLFNLGVTYYSADLYPEAEEYLVKGIKINFSHPGGHLILARSMAPLNQRIKSMLAFYYFLMLEQGTDRTSEAFEQLEMLWNRDISKGKDGSTNIKMVSPKAKMNPDPFLELDRIVSIYQVTSTVQSDELGELFEKDTNKFLFKTQLLIESLNEFKPKTKKSKKKNKESQLIEKDFWWDFYGQFFIDLSNSDHLETYCYFIQHSIRDDALLWCENHPEKLKKFATWLNKYFND